MMEGKVIPVYSIRGEDPGPAHHTWTVFKKY
uniref:Uncharacterized protein n=1 Tax=Anguilla anguilla TaxID=7936 RepID=A0A0E9W5W1_ANGAN